MKTTVTMWATKAAGAGAVALLLATPAFAQSRGDWSRNTNSNRGAQATQTRANNRGQQYDRWNQAQQTQPVQAQATQPTQTRTENRAQYNQYNRSNQAQATQPAQTPTENRAQYNQYNQYNRSNQAQQQTYERSRGQFNNNSYRENQRVTASGRITSFARERDGYRVQLDRGGSYWVPESRGRGLRVGLSINLGGIFRGGSIFVDSLGYPAGYAYDNGYVRGVVESVDYRTGTVWLQDDASGREIRADVGGYALGSLQRGEFVELTGQWLGNGVFNVAQIASIR
jgi:hypothetical protein